MPNDEDTLPAIYWSRPYYSSLQWIDNFIRNQQTNDLFEPNANKQYQLLLKITAQESF